MKIMTGNMLSVVGTSDFVFFTANSTQTINNHLVMGKGIALQFKNLMPDLPFELGRKIYKARLFGKWYGIMDSGLHIGKSSIWAFQTKTSYKRKSNTQDLILSISLLRHLAMSEGDKRFDLNYPAIGLGGLSREIVSPMISILPDNVTIWQKA